MPHRLDPPPMRAHQPYELMSDGNNGLWAIGRVRPRWMQWIGFARVARMTRWRYNEFRAWEDAADACVNRVRDDWHGVGYCRMRAAQSAPPQHDPWLHHYIGEPAWLREVYGSTWED